MDSIRQRKVAELIKTQLSEIFQRQGYYTLKGSLVTITEVRVTPDLLEAKIFLSIYNAKNKQEILDALEEHHREIKKLLGNKMAKQLRRIPEIEFLLDDTLEEVFKLEALFNKIKKDEK